MHDYNVLKALYLNCEICWSGVQAVGRGQYSDVHEEADLYQNFEINGPSVRNLGPWAGQTWPCSEMCLNLENLFLVFHIWRR